MDDAVTLYVGSKPLATVGPAGQQDCVCSVPNKLRALLATEYQAFAMYRHAAYLMRGKDRIDFTADLLKHASEELGHADNLEQRLLEIGGTTFKDTNDYGRISPAPTPTLCSSTPESIFAVIEQSEMDAIRLYKEAFWFCMEQGDIVSAKIIRNILAVEEEHLADVRLDYQGKDSAV